MSLGTEKIEAVAESAKKIAILAKKVAEDKKVSIEDLAHLVAFLPELGGVIENFKALGEAFEEGKDLDVAEVVKLIQVVHAKVKEVEAA